MNNSVLLKSELLSKIRPSVESFTDYHGEKTSKNDEFVDMVAKKK